MLHLLKTLLISWNVIPSSKSNSFTLQHSLLSSNFWEFYILKISQFFQCNSMDFSISTSSHIAQRSWASISMVLNWNICRSLNFHLLIWKSLIKHTMKEIKLSRLLGLSMIKTEMRNLRILCFSTVRRVKLIFLFSTNLFTRKTSMLPLLGYCRSHI